MILLLFAKYLPSAPAGQGQVDADRNSEGCRRNRRDGQRHPPGHHEGCLASGEDVGPECRPGGGEYDRGRDASPDDPAHHNGHEFAQHEGEPGAPRHTKSAEQSESSTAPPYPDDRGHHEHEDREQAGSPE
jgi:hypothetical protein